MSLRLTENETIGKNFRHNLYILHIVIHQGLVENLVKRPEAFIPDFSL